MTIVILFGLENVMRAGLICLSNVEHGKMASGTSMDKNVQGFAKHNSFFARDLA